jgi:hypothetical protein
MADRREEILKTCVLSGTVSNGEVHCEISEAKNAMDEYSKEWKRQYEEANQFILDLGKLIGLDGLGYDDIKASIEDFRDSIDGKKKEMCLALLEYMAKNNIKSTWYMGDDGERRYIFVYNREDLTKEQLFENFL